MATDAFDDPVTQLSLENGFLPAQQAVLQARLRIDEAKGDGDKGE